MFEKTSVFLAFFLRGNEHREIRAQNTVFFTVPLFNRLSLDVRDTQKAAVCYRNNLELDASSSEKEVLRQSQHTK